MEKTIYKFKESLKKNNIPDVTNPAQTSKVWENLTNSKKNKNEENYMPFRKEDFKEYFFFPR